MSFEEAALCEPLSVALQACERTRLGQFDKSVTIFGCGAIGLLVAAVAKSKGAYVTMTGTYIPLDYFIDKIFLFLDFNSLNRIGPWIGLSLLNDW